MRLSVIFILPLFSLSACKEEGTQTKDGVDQSRKEKSVARVSIPNDLIHSQPITTEGHGVEGRRLAVQHCQRCHMFVEPGALPKAIWRDVIFPRMGAFMGMQQAGVKTIVDYGRHPSEKKMIHDAGIYPPRAEMTLKDWKVLVAYYIDGAPETLSRPAEVISIAPSSELFQEADFGYRQHDPNTTMVSIDEAGKRLFVGDRATKELSVLKSDLSRIQKIKMASPPAHMKIINGELWVTQIGLVNPSDSLGGELTVFQEDDGYFTAGGQQKLSQLRRPTHASYADMNKDGLLDVVISEHGNQLGALNYYQAKKNGGYQKVELMNEPGAMTSHIRDFNNDGWLDVAVILGQNREGVHIHYNKGDGSFAWSYALPVPSHYGSVSFSFYDFDGDGYLDILATNGDNGDYRAILKPHHGVRIYLNDGKNAFHERYFFHMNGAYKALAEDFDLDGDLDIAAISMFPDFNNRPEEGFLYLENDGKLKFKASTIKRVKEGRWLCMDTGDLDGDGDKDIVLGSFIRGPSEVPPSFMEAWEKGALPGLVLWNKTK